MIYYKINARKRGVEFSLSREEFLMITQKDCYYCGDKPNNKTILTSGAFIYNGIDRVNSNEGYNLNNIVPCCINCNIAKNDLGKEEFLNMIKKIYERHYK